MVAPKASTPSAPDRRAPAWLFVAAAAFAGYLGLLLYCDLKRPLDPGLSVVVEAGRLLVAAVTPGSVAATAGLAAGDELAAVDGRPLTWRLDWFAVAAQIRPGVPVSVSVSGPTPRQLTLIPAPSGPAHWRRREGLALAAARLTQIVSLALAILVVLRRPFDTRARLGAWLLASIGVFCIAPPWGQAAVWRALPAPLGWLLWLPHLSALAIGAILASFLARFRPDATPLHRIRLMALVWIPTAIALIWHARFAWLTVYAPSRSVPASLWSVMLPALTLLYTAGGLALLVWIYRRIVDLNERRRVRVLVAGTLVGVSAALAVVTVYWGGSDAELAPSPFTSTALFAGTLVSLVFPVSLAHAILRHRLLDVSLIIRQGLRYALARRALLSAAPALALLVSVDLMAHADQPVSAILASRGWVYALLLAGVALARLWRDTWLEALDRRFFRDRYQAQRIIREVLVSMREAGTIEPAAPRIVEAVGQALHPTYVALVSRTPEGEGTTVLACTPTGATVPRLARHSRVLDLARTLGRPLDLAPEVALRLVSQLPEDESTIIRAGGLELVVPIPPETGRTDRLRGSLGGREARRHGAPEAAAELFLLLGPKRSAEPYTSEDVELVATIAESLAAARPPQPAAPALPMAELAAPHHDPATLAECPECGRCEGAAVPTCPDDGTPMVVVPIPRRLNGRYAIERRLGRGGMGSVYLAHDTALDRRVAIKVVRWASLGNHEATGRFIREARAGASLSHANVVTVHDVGVAPDGTPFLVMEYVPGPTLRARLIEETTIEPAAAVTLLRGMAAGIEAAHAAGLVHRDLKPENILLAHGAAGPVPKIADFGLARACAVNPAGPATFLTRDGGTPGTPEYMAPEQIRQEEPAPAWDRWALGVIAFEMLTGELPFAGTVGEGRTLRTPLVDGGDDALLRTFREVLAPDASRRPATATALVEAIARAVSRHDG